MTILQKFSNNLETIPEKINIISATLSGIIIYFILPPPRINRHPRNFTTTLSF